jgi:hypothetical protein
MVIYRGEYSTADEETYKEGKEIAKVEVST